MQHGADLSTPAKHTDSLSLQISNPPAHTHGSAPEIRSEEERGGKKLRQTSGALPLFEKCHKETRRIRKCQVWYVKESSITQSFDNYAVKRVPEKQQLN